MTTNPCSSRPIWGGSQSVCGTAPISTTRAEAGTVSASPVLASFKTRASSLPLPSAPAIWVLVRTSMLAVAMISSIRYCDIRATRASPRTTIVTCRAYRARLTAAWPAELAPPAMKTWLPTKALLSDVVAP